MILNNADELILNYKKNDRKSNKILHNEMDT